MCKTKIRRKCYDTDSFIIDIKTEHIYLVISRDIETRFDTAHYELERLLPRGKCKTVLGLMKDAEKKEIEKKERFCRIETKNMAV